MHATTTTDQRDHIDGEGRDMQANRLKSRPRGVTRLVRRLERERRTWSRPQEAELPTAQAWRAGVAEGLRLAQVAVRKGA